MSSGLEEANPTSDDCSNENSTMKADDAHGIRVVKKAIGRTMLTMPRYTDA